MQEDDEGGGHEHDQSVSHTCTKLPKSKLIKKEQETAVVKVIGREPLSS